MLDSAAPIVEDSAAPTAAAGQFSNLSTLIVAAAVGVTSMSFNLWWPFLPLYVLELGATSDADALFWVAMAATGQGLARLASGPVWGVISDRVGRKAMFLRALYLSTLVGGAAGLASEPWQLIIALTLAGLFSGFNPAAIALVSVSVPESRLNRSLGLLAGAQYIGTTAGPALGAVMAPALGFRAAILATSAVPLLTGTAVLFFVPADRVERVARRTPEQKKAAAIEPFRMTFQLALVIFLYGMIFAVNQLTRFATPIALKAIEGSSSVETDSGITFSLGGLISAFSVLVLAPYFYRRGRMRLALAVSCGIGAIGMLMLALAGHPYSYAGGFLVIAAVLSAMTPATNTLIAENVTRGRRGTAFGVAGSAQALASIAGPGMAAIFAAISLDLGFAFLAAVLVAVGLLLGIALREPVGP